MYMQEYKSEVARIRAQIELECEAIRRVFEEPARYASHSAIDARYRNLGMHQDTLELHVGGKEAILAVVEIYQRVVG
ncbi:MAG: hypothetical protein NVS4B7_21250 [Ktedonobacteraceae bacterium]